MTTTDQTLFDTQGQAAAQQAPQGKPTANLPAGCVPQSVTGYRNWHGELMLNPSVERPDEERLTRLSRKMLNLFRDAYRKGQTVSTSQLVEVSAQYNSRVWELRRWLVPQGFCIDLIRRGQNGENHYGVVALKKSCFYLKHKAKLEAEAIR